MTTDFTFFLFRSWRFIIFIMLGFMSLFFGFVGIIIIYPSYFITLRLIFKNYIFSNLIGLPVVLIHTFGMMILQERKIELSFSFLESFLTGYILISCFFTFPTYYVFYILRKFNFQFLEWEKDREFITVPKDFTIKDL